jgi:hypothetical protein
MIGHGKRTGWKRQGDLLAKRDNLLYIAPNVLVKFIVIDRKPLPGPCLLIVGEETQCFW